MFLPSVIIYPIRSMVFTGRPKKIQRSGYTKRRDIMLEESIIWLSRERKKNPGESLRQRDPLGLELFLISLLMTLSMQAVKYMIRQLIKLTIVK